MATSYFETAWNTAGTFISNSSPGGGAWKDVVVTGAQVGDLIVAFGVGENNRATPANRTVVTQTGTAGRTGSWTTLSPSLVNAQDVAVVAGLALITTAGTTTVRVTLDGNSGDFMGAGALLIPAAEIGSTYALGNAFVGDADGQISLTIPASSLVFQISGDWSALNPGTTTVPAGGTARQTYNDGTRYAVFVAEWRAQAAGTRNYGPSGLSGRDFSGLFFRMDETGGTTYTKSVADSEPITDTASTKTTRPRSASDSEPIIDTVGVAAGRPRSAADSEPVTDAVSFVAELARGVDDGVGIADEAVASLTGPTYSDWWTANVTVPEAGVTQVDDPVGITDEITAVQNVARTHNDGLGITDAASADSEGPVYSEWWTANVTVGQGEGIGVGDPVGITDEVVAQRTLSALVEDAVGIVDTGDLQTIDYHYALDDDLDLDDDVTAVREIVALVNDAVPIGDAASAQISNENGATVNDPLGITDEVAVVMSRVVTVQDFLGIIDESTGSLAGNKHAEPEDSVSIADAVSVSLSRTTTIADGVGLADAVATEWWSGGRLVSDEIAITDSLAIIRLGGRAFSEPLGITDRVHVVLVRPDDNEGGLRYPVMPYPDLVIDNQPPRNLVYRGPWANPLRNLSL